VAWLSERLREAGFTPGIITRGYKRRRRGVFCVDPKADQASGVGDEALLLARRLKTPVIVGVDRAKAIELGISMFNIDLALLDDGFQLKGLRKDVEICLLNGKDNGEAGLFPAGPYREEKERIKDADIVLINKGEPDRALKGYI
jgi:tetraacyldisaccharide 4'-kinase